MVRAGRARPGANAGGCVAKNAEDKHLDRRGFLECMAWGSVSVLNGHIHQVMQKVEGHKEEPAMASVGDHAVSAALIVG